LVTLFFGRAELRWKLNRKARKERKDKNFLVSLAFCFGVAQHKFAPFAVSNWLGFFSFHLLA